MRYQLRLFFTALAFLTRIPCGALPSSEVEDFGRAAKFFPLVGLMVGMLTAMVYAAAHWAFPQEIAVLAAMAASIWITGAFHEDGLADAADGLGGGWTKEQTLAIMQDSRLGSYGAIALFLMLATKFQTLSYLDPRQVPFALIAGNALSRLTPVLLMGVQDYVRTTGKGRAFSAKPAPNEWLLATVFGLAPLALLPGREGLAALALLPVWLWFSRLLKRKLGGYTGDCLGAMQQLCELAFYLGLLGLS
jgi:adenosylcobinamide-GDP ribazoletransferase